MKNIKLITKIMCGFAALLILLVIVGYSGFNGMTGVVDRVIKADNVNKMVKHILKARQHEKNFIIQKDLRYTTEMATEIKALSKQIADTQAIFAQEINRKQMAEVKTQADKYYQEFQNYVKLKKQRDQAMTQMRAKASDSIKQLEMICKNQEEQLKYARKANITQVHDKVEKTNDANRIIKWFITVRKNEKELIISNGDKKWQNKHSALMTKIFTLLADLKSRSHNIENIREMDKTQAELKQYYRHFNEFTKDMQQQHSNMEQMRRHARGTLRQLEMISSDQEAQLLKGKNNKKIEQGTIQGIFR